MTPELQSSFLLDSHCEVLPSHSYPFLSCKIFVLFAGLVVKQKICNLEAHPAISEMVPDSNSSIVECIWIFFYYMKLKFFTLKINGIINSFQQ